MKTAATERGAAMMTEKMSAHPRRDGEGVRIKQVKVSVPAEAASAFKSACAASNSSMASALPRFMAGYSKTEFAGRSPPPDYSTKRQRRAAVHRHIRILEQIRDSEERYRDRIPENLQGSAAYESAEEFISCLDAAIDALDSIDSI
jgi:hypothetical protein